MAILFSGDFHANAVNELSAITKTTLFALYGRSVFDAIRRHIILGDGGFLWPGNQQTDAYNFKILSRRPFPVLCVIGNHEPMLGMMDDLEEADIGIGERVYRISKNPFVAYLKRGKVYTIDGFKFLVLGGALSVDKYRRIPGISWWEKEYWTEDEKEDLSGGLRRAPAAQGIGGGRSRPAIGASPMAGPERSGAPESPVLAPGLAPGARMRPNSELCCASVGFKTASVYISCKIG